MPPAAPPCRDPQWPDQLPGARRATELIGGGAMRSRRFALDQRVVEGAQQCLDARHLVGLVDRGAKLRGSGEPLRVPAEMLPGDTQTYFAAVMAQHVVVMAADDLVLHGEWRVGALAPVAQPLGDLP